jgi:hypothetical protein
MKNLFRLIVLVLFVGGWGLAATSLHVVRTPTASREFIIVPKNRIGIEDTYVDTRAWTIDDVPSHKSVVGRLIETDKYMALAHVTGETEPAEVQQRLADALMRAPQPNVEATTTPAKTTERQSPSVRKDQTNRQAELAKR